MGLTYIVVAKAVAKDPLSPICVTEGPDASLYGLGIPGVPNALCTVELSVNMLTTVETLVVTVVSMY